MDDRVSIVSGTSDFSCNDRNQTGCEGHPAFCPVGTGCSFPGGKCDFGVKLANNVLLVPNEVYV
jgi:hypothetical protein